jgi:hypothetical protein
MRPRYILALALALAGRASAAPVPGTCTVTSMASLVRSLNFEFPIPPPANFQFPISVDAETGVFTLDRTGWPAEYGFTTFGTVQGFLTLPQDVVTGTIDAAGNVVLPNFSMTFDTDFCAGGCPFDATFTIATGLGATVFGAAVYVVDGVPLDFQTGAMTLEGHAAAPDAPGGGSTTGLKISCVVAPIPTGLPKGPTLASHVGKIKIGPALPASAPPPGGTVAGDELTLRAKVKAGRAVLDANADLWIQLVDGSGHQAALLLVAKSALQAKGKTLVATDTDGSVIQVLGGRKKNAQVSATLGGKLVIHPSKKALTLSLHEVGLDLGSLASGTLVVQVGDQATHANMAVRGTGTTRRLK